MSFCGYVINHKKNLQKIRINQKLLNFDKRLKKHLFVMAILYIWNDMFVAL